MLRKLLTLLALCAGLAAVAEPARASVGAVESVRLVEQTGHACGVAARAPSVERASLALRGERRLKMCLRPALPIVVPTVMLQGDRAHE